MEFVPALSILGVLLILAIVLIFRFKRDEALQVFESKNFFLVATLVVIFLLLASYLFDNTQTWISDLLKIAIGVFAGASAVSLTGNRSINMGDQNQTGDVALGDMIKTYNENINEKFQEIRDSVVTQNTTIDKFISTNLNHNEDLIFHRLYSKTSLYMDIQNVIATWTKKGWRFKNITTDFQGIDCMILIFSKNNAGSNPKISFYSRNNFDTPDAIQ